MSDGKGACDYCRSHRVKCKGRIADSVACEQCSSRDLPCLLEREVKRRGPRKGFRKSEEPIAPNIPISDDYTQEQMWRVNCPVQGTTNLPDLPSLDRCIVLVHAAFSKHQPIIQIIHQPSFLRAMSLGSLPPLLFTAVITLGSRLISDAPGVEYELLHLRFITLLGMLEYKIGSLEWKHIASQHPGTNRGPDWTRLYPHSTIDLSTPSFELLQAQILYSDMLSYDSVPRNRLMYLVDSMWSVSKHLKLHFDPSYVAPDWMRETASTQQLPWANGLENGKYRGMSGATAGLIPKTVGLASSLFTPQVQGGFVVVPDGLGLSSSYLDQEVRRRTVWFLFIMDKPIAMLCMSPFTIRPDDLRVFQMPIHESKWIDERWQDDEYYRSSSAELETSKRPCTKCQRVDENQRWGYPEMFDSECINELGFIACLDSSITLEHMDPGVGQTALVVICADLLGAVHLRRARMSTVTTSRHLGQKDVVNRSRHIFECLFPAWLKLMDIGNSFDHNFANCYGDCSEACSRGTTIAEAVWTIDGDLADLNSSDQDWQMGQTVLILFHWSRMLLYSVHSVFWFSGEAFFQLPLAKMWASSSFVAESLESCVRIANLLHACRRVHQSKFPPRVQQRNVWKNPIVGHALFQLGHATLVIFSAFNDGFVSPELAAKIQGHDVRAYISDYLWGLDEISRDYKHCAELAAHLRDTVDMLGLPLGNVGVFPELVSQRRIILLEALHGALISPR
jgi:hypothetical protein